MRINVPVVGFLIGLFLPVIGFFIVYSLMFKATPIGTLLGSLMHDHRSASKVLTLSLLINLLPFVYFNTKRLDHAMRGIVSATMLYALVIVLIMFVW